MSRGVFEPNSTPGLTRIHVAVEAQAREGERRRHNISAAERTNAGIATEKGVGERVRERAREAGAGD